MSQKIKYITNNKNIGPDSNKTNRKTRPYFEQNMTFP